MDNQLPTVTCDASTVWLDAFGESIVVADDFITATADQCGAVTKAIAPDTLNCTNLGVENVVVTVTDIGGNMTTCGTTVTVLDTITPELSACPNDTTTDNSAGNCNVSITWTAPTATDNCTLPAITSSHNPGDDFMVGTTTVTYWATDDAGNQDSCSFEVTVNHTFSDTVPPVLVNCPNDMTSCSPVSAFIPPTATDNCNVDSLLRNVTETTTFTGIEHDFLYIAVDASGNRDSCEFTITQFPLPSAHAGDDDTITAGEQTTIGGSPAATGGAGGYSYLWYPSTGLDDSTLANPTAAPLSDITYLLFAIDTNGCAGTDLVNVMVNPAFGNGGGAKLSDDLEVNIYPNPAKEVLHFSIEDNGMNGPFKIELTDVLGRKLFSTEFTEMTDDTINLTGLTRGQYVLRVTSGGNQALRYVTKL